MLNKFPYDAIHFPQKRPQSVLDPYLVLSPYGLPLTKHLGTVQELWVARELWQILDHTYLSELCSDSLTLPDPRAWQDWTWVKGQTPPAYLNLFWLGDRPGESFLPSDVDPFLYQRWEWLDRSLDEQINCQNSPQNFLTPALRDTIALATALDGATILTYQSPENAVAHLPPPLGHVLAAWNIPCLAIAPHDRFAREESKNFLYLLAQTGLSKLVWSGLNLAIIHLFVPAASSLCYRNHCLPNFSSSEEDFYLDFPSSSLWEGARGFWYQI